MSLELSYQVAEDIMRKNASSFYVTFEKIERSKFLDIAAVYAFVDMQMIYQIQIR